MKFFKILIFYLSLSYSFNATGEIFYVDLDKIINQSEPGKFINQKVNKLNKLKENEFKIIRDELKKKEQQLISQKNILEANEFNKKVISLKKEFDNFNNQNSKRIDAQQKNLIKYKTKLLELIEPILIDYMNENNINYLLRKQNILVGREDLNKTEEIILIVNEKINNQNFND